MKERRLEARTHYIHRISYTIQERIVGLFVIIAVGILIWLLLASGKSTISQEESFTIYGKLESVEGISKNTEIKIAGLNAGTLDSIDIKEDNAVVITMTLLDKYHKLLRTDSIAKLSNPGIALLGGSVINISAGSSDQPRLDDGDTIIVTQTPGIKETIESITPTFVQLQTSIKRINDILDKIEPNDVSSTLENIRDASTHLTQISAQVSSGKGLAGSLLFDDGIQENTKDIVKNLLDITEVMEEIIATLNKEVANMPELVEKIGPLLNQADKTIKATQRIWPLSSAIGESKKQHILTSPAPAGD